MPAFLREFSKTGIDRFTVISDHQNGEGPVSVQPRNRLLNRKIESFQRNFIVPRYLKLFSC